MSFFFSKEAGGENLFILFVNFLGISQLHWCLRFLLDLKNTEGEYTRDINVCIQAVQDNLIEQYANLGTVLENQSESSSKNEGKDNNKKKKGGVKYEDEKVNPEYRENENLELGKDLDERDKVRMKFFFLVLIHSY